MDTDVPSDQSAPARRRIRLGSRLLTALADLAMPPVCLGCQCRLVDHHALCASCWSAIEFIRPPLCARLGIPLPYGVGEPTISAAAAAHPPDYDRARAVGVYADTFKTLIHDFKFRDRQELRKLFLRWLYDAGTPFWPDANLLLPVPLHRSRLLRRRFNQAAVLAAGLSKMISCPYAPTVLQRTRATAQQVGLTVAQRRDNVRGAFAVKAQAAARLHGAHVVLVDDVITTGATVSACARILRSAGVAKIDVLTLAITVPGRDSNMVSGGLVVP